jgi:hypothetical protein
MKRFTTILLAAIAIAPALSAATLPRIDLRVSVAKETFDDVLPAAQVREIPASVQSVLLARCTQYIKFLAWTTGDAASTTHLDAVIRPENSTILLDFSAVIDGVPLASQPTMTSIVLYDAYYRPPDPKGARQYIAEKVRNGFDEAFRARLHEAFLSHVPLTREPLRVVDPEMVIVPLSRTLLRVKETSVLMADFDDAQVPSVLRIVSLPRGYSDDISCRVLSLRRGGKITDGWSKEIPKIFGTPPRARRVLVTMAKYVFDPNPGTRADGTELRLP